MADDEQEYYNKVQYKLMGTHIMGGRHHQKYKDVK